MEQSPWDTNSYSRNYPPFMESEISLQESAAKALYSILL